MLTRVASACLTMFVEPLLHDAIHGRLDFARKAALAELRLEVDVQAARLRERLGKSLERRDEAEVVERLRSQLHREPPDVLERCDDELAEVGDGAAGLVVEPGLVDRAEPEQDRRQGLTRLVVQLAGEPASLQLLTGDDASERVPSDAPRQVDGDRGAQCELLRDPQVPSW